MIDTENADIVRAAIASLPEIRPVWRGIMIRNDQQYHAAASLLLELTGAQKRIHAVLDPIVDSANKHHKLATKQRNGALAPLALGVAELKAAMVEFDRAQKAEADKAKNDGTAPAISGATVPIISGMARTQRWRAIISDPEALIQYVAADFKHRAHLIKWNTRELDKMAGAHREGLPDHIPGLEAEGVESISAKASA